MIHALLVNLYLLILGYCRFVEIMAPVFSRKAWRCIWYIIQVHNCDHWQFTSFTLIETMDTESCLLSSNICHACLWLQNDLVHGWGLDFALRRCVTEVIIILNYALSEVHVWSASYGGILIT